MKEAIMMKEITVQELQLDSRRIGGDWMLITASWGLEKQYPQRDFHDMSIGGAEPRA